MTVPLARPPFSMVWLPFSNSRVEAEPLVTPRSTAPSATPNTIWEPFALTVVPLATPPDSTFCTP